MFKLEHISGLVWCGKMGTLDQLIQGRKVGDELAWWSFTSTSLSSEVSLRFISTKPAGIHPADTPGWPLPRVIFKIQIAAGVQISSFSDFRGVEEGKESEQEVIVLPGTRFVIDAIYDLGGGLTEVRMHEVVGRGGGIEAALAERRPGATAVGRRRLSSIPDGDRTMMRAYSDAGVDEMYAGMVYEDVVAEQEGTYAEAY